MKLKASHATQKTQIESLSKNKENLDNAQEVQRFSQEQKFL